MFRHRIRIYEKLISWIGEKLSRSQFILMSAVLVGLSAGIAAVVLKTLVHYVREIILFLPVPNWENLFYLLGPAIGILATVAYISFSLKGNFDRGLSNVLYSIKKKYGLMSSSKMYTHMITSSLTIGLGGSAGLESPIVVTGAAIGSNYSRVYRMVQRERSLMLACGVAAGIAAVFNAPIAGVIFALEAIITGATINAFIPIIIASVSGSLTAMIILKEDILLSYKNPLVFDYHNIPYYIVFAALGGLLAVYYGRTAWRIDNYFKRQNWNVWRKAITGSAILCLMIFVFPTLFGEGYESIKDLMYGRADEIFKNSFFSRFILNEWSVLFFIGITGVVKVIATTCTLSAGGNGGNFAPSLFVGAYFGFFFSRLINLSGLTDLNETNFIIVGMAGLLSGILYAPLTGIFLIAELTGGYDLMLPIMLASAVSFAIAHHFEKYPVDKRALMQQLDDETSVPKT